jgi:lipid A ethanolaminephosphotransferase
MLPNEALRLCLEIVTSTLRACVPTVNWKLSTPFYRGFLPRPVWSQERLMLVISLWFTLACNLPFWREVLQGRALSAPDTWFFILGLGALITTLHFLLPALLGGRRTLKPLLALLLVIAGITDFYIDKFGIYIDANMLSNVLHTDWLEAGELLTWDLLHLALFLTLPLVLLYRVELVPRRPGRALLMRGFALAVALLVGMGGLMLNFQELAALMRNHRETRYLVTPGNAVYALARALNNEAGAAPQEKQVTAPDAAPGPAWRQRVKPVLFVIIVGETARAANWGLHTGLDGQLRQTTPELSKLDVIQFGQVTSCGASTEVSLPCMFSPQGRRHYNARAIRGSESLLHVLSRAGFRVVWLDNQSGCKGVCSGLEQQRLHKTTDPALCDKTRCLDEILLQGARALTDNAENGKDNLVLVLHPLGNHGPAYHKRYPESFRRFTPACDTQDLRQCGREEITNSYDNALLYTDHFLAQTVAFLKERNGQYDTAMIYVSDHGESLGENGLFLHGTPYAIAPKEQTQVPMLMWFSPAYARDFGVDTACLRQHAEKPASHDNLFHSVLGLLDVETRTLNPALDLSDSCRS